MDEINQDDLLQDEYVEKKPIQALWIVYLFFRPRKFFRHFATESNAALTLVCAWFFGMSGVIDRLSTREVKGLGEPFEENWLLRWLFIAGIGVVGGVMFYGIGGWWYRVRLGWAGATRADPFLARRVYLFASQILAVPTLLVTAFETISYDSPAAANMTEGSIWWAFILICPFWASLASTIGVFTIFEVKRGLALLWFLILPWAIYLLVYFPFFTMLLTGSDILAHPALKNPKTHESETLSFSYPRNWVIDKTNEAYDPECCVTVEPALADAIVKILVFFSDNTLDEELDASFAGYADGFRDVQIDKSISSIGAFEGSLRSGTCTVHGNTYVVRFFIAQLESGAYLELQEFSLQKQEATLREGFDLIYSTLRVD